VPPPPISLALAAAVASLVVLPRPAAAGEPCEAGSVLRVDGLSTPSAELARLADLAQGAIPADSGMVRRGGAIDRPQCREAEPPPGGARYLAPPSADGAWLDAVPARVFTTARSLPGGGNDGLLWQGRGISTAASGGVRGGYASFSFQLAPVVTWSQNDWFRTVPTGASGELAFAEPFQQGWLDVPQRFGAGPVARAGLGQSYAQVEALGAQAGLSTENLWWGPGVRNTLLLSNTADGFPHLFLGTARPVSIGIGTLEARLVAGRLTRSRFYAAEERTAAISALAIVYQPRWIGGLYVGAGRAVVETWDALQRDSFVSIARPFRAHALDDNEILTFWGRWVFPAVGLELYAEWGRDDTASGASMVRVLDRTSGAILGMQKRFTAGARWVVLHAELARTYDGYPAGYTVPFYTHPEGTGWTHGGQLLGAWIGSGGASQYLALDVLSAGGRVGGFLERVVRNEDYFWREVAGPDRGTDHDAELAAGVRQVTYAGPLEISWQASGGYRWNRDFLRNEPVFQVSLGLALPLGIRRATP
jgi:hypothetical protein